MHRRLALAVFLSSSGASAHAAPTIEPVPGAPSLTTRTNADATHCGGFDVTVRASRDAKSLEPELVAALTLDAPRGLDFDPDHAKAQAASVKRFGAWFADAMATLDKAHKRYEARAADTSLVPAARVEAIARLVQLDRRFADVLARMEIPRSVRTGPYAADATVTFCDTLAEKAQPLIDRADKTAETCRKVAADAKLGPSWWTDVCKAP